MYFFCFQITAVINKIEKNTQRDLNFIFYEISEYVNFFCLKMFPSQKKLLVNTNFMKMMLHVNEVHENYGEFTLVAIIQHMILLQSLPFKNQNGDV